MLNADAITEIAAKAKPAVVQIITFDRNRELLKSGTGFFVSGDGYLLPNNHVIDGGSYVTARTSSGATYQFDAVVVRSADPDLAVLKFTITDVPHLQLGSSADAVEGQKDSRNYSWVHSTVYPNTFTHGVSDQYSSYWSGPMLYDSINIYSEAQERNDKLHKAMTRLTVGYVIDSSGRPAIYSMTLKVL